MRVRLELQAGAGCGALDHPNPAVVNGDPRSLTKTKGDVGLSRWSRRNDRSSSPWIGWVLGVPFLTRRTSSTAPLKSTWVPAQVADLRCPQSVPVGQEIIVASRWP